MGGDGTVPRVSATPIETDDDAAAVPADVLVGGARQPAGRRGRADPAARHPHGPPTGRLPRRAGHRASRPTTCSPSVSRLAVRALPDAAGLTLRASVVDVATGRSAGEVVLARDADEVHTGELPPLPGRGLPAAGRGRSSVSAPLADPVHSLLCVSMTPPPDDDRRDARDDVRAARRRRRLPAAAHAAVRLPQRHRRPRDVPAGARRGRPRPAGAARRRRDPRHGHQRVPRAPRRAPAPATSPSSRTAATAARSRRRPAVADLEPSGRIQTIMLHDCGRRVDGKLRRALADKELSLLIAEVAASGAHVVTILDCCHSGGGTRDPYARPRAWMPRPADVDAGRPRRRAALAAERPSTEFIAGALEHWRAPRPPHVALGGLSVRRDGQGAPRRRRQPRGLLGRPARRARRARVAHDLPLAAGDGALTRRTHGGRATAGAVPAGRRWRRRRPVPRRRRRARSAPSFTVTRGVDGWEVDAGIVHGLRDPVGDEAFVLACSDDDGTAAGMVRVTHVEVGRSAVEPVDWTPADRAYRAAVVVGAAAAGRGAARPARGRRPTGRRRRGRPRRGARRRRHGRARRRAVGGGARRRRRPRRHRVPCACGCRCPAPGTARIARADGNPVVGDVDEADGAGARLVVSRLEHVAGWELDPGPRRPSVTARRVS